MKKYRKAWGKTYQVRLSKEEYKDFIDFVERFGITHREFILGIMNYLSTANYYKNGWFYRNIKEYAYTHGELKGLTASEASYVLNAYWFKKKGFYISKARQIIQRLNKKEWNTKDVQIVGSLPKEN